MKILEFAFYVNIVILPHQNFQLLLLKRQYSLQFLFTTIITSASAIK